MDCFANIRNDGWKKRQRAHHPSWNEAGARGADAPLRLPDGQITSPCADRLSSPCVKNILIFRRPKSLYNSWRPVPSEGRLAIVTNAGRDAVDVDVPLTNGTEADGEVVWS